MRRFLEKSKFCEVSYKNKRFACEWDLCFETSNESNRIGNSVHKVILKGICPSFSLFLGIIRDNSQRRSKRDPSVDRKTGLFE